MKRNIIYKSVFAAGCLCLLGSSLQSCNDYLTVYPTDQITEEQFWQDKTDLDNVRAAAYRKLTESGTTAKILMWGEFRSDNLVLNKMEETSLMHLQNAVLMPTESMFDWSNFYTGINYCNMVIERGERMIQEQTDPSFSDGDWRPIKSEMQALRALYYFYLVRAFRDVPFDGYATLGRRLVLAGDGFSVLHLSHQVENIVLHGTVHQGRPAVDFVR